LKTLLIIAVSPQSLTHLSHLQTSQNQTQPYKQTRQAKNTKTNTQKTNQPQNGLSNKKPKKHNPTHKERLFTSLMQLQNIKYCFSNLIVLWSYIFG